MKKLLLLGGSFGGLLCFFKYMAITMEEEQEKLRKKMEKKS